MSRIDELIDRLCPDGVAHHPLGQIAAYSKTRVDAAKVNETNFIGVDNLIPNKGGKTNASYPPNTARLTAYETGDILIGNIRPYLKKIWLATSPGGCSGDILAVRISDSYCDEINPLFLYYVLSSDNFFVYNMRHSKGAKMPRGNKDAILQYRIPVPPLEVQVEIVRILAQFTDLEAELQAELEARRRQYEHYQHSLLSFDDDAVQWMSLGDIGRVAMCKRVFKSETASTGEIPFFKIGTFGGKPDAFISKELYEDYRSRFSFPKRGDVLISAAGTIGRAIQYDGKPAYFQDSNIVWVDNDESIVSNAYLRYWYRVIAWTTDGGTIRRLYNENIRRARIAVPSRDEQNRIVSILDKLDSLVHDTNSGIPAELHARRRQFEYYRDRLLTFEDTTA